MISTPKSIALYATAAGCLVAVFWLSASLGWVPAALGVQSSESAARYITAAVEKGQIERVITTTGTLNAIVNVEVGSQLSGQIAELLIDFNDEVKKGQPLARLDQKSFRARVSEAQAALEIAQVSVTTARARLERSEIDARDSEAQRAVLRARTDNARLRLQAAQNELRRKETLFERQVGSTVDLEDAQNKLGSAAAALREAEAIQAAHENVVAGRNSDVVRVRSELEAALATVPQRQALLDIAKIELGRTTIVSPIDGVVVGRNVNSGQTLATTLEAKTLFIIAGDLHQMEIHARVDEADIGKLRAGQPAIFTVDAYPGRQFIAVVRQVRKAPQVQQNVVTYTVVLSAINRENLLLPGMTALVRVTVQRTETVLKVPTAALRFVPNDARSPPLQQAEVTQGKAATVWLANGNEIRPIVLGIGKMMGSTRRS